MDKKPLLQLCSYLYLFVLCLATGAQQPQQKSGQQLSTVKDVLQDLQKSASGYGGYEEEKEEEGGGKGYFSKGLKGGFDKGSKKYGMDEYDKKGNDYGKNGFKKYDMKDKYGNQKYEKKDMNAFGEKWADKNGKENKGKWEEWADNKKWKSDKGKGYEKAYEYDKSDGVKNSYGKKGKNDMVKYEDKHGEKNAMNKKKLDSKDMYGKKVNNGKQANNEYGKMYKMGGKNNKGMNFYEQKKPSSYKMSKFEQMKKPPPPKKMVEKKEEGKGYEDEAYDMGDNEHSMPEEDHGYDMADAGGMAGHDLGGEYDQGGHELAYDDTQGLPQKYVPQEVAYATLGQEAGYVVLEDQSAIPMTEFEGHDLY